MKHNFLTLLCAFCAVCCLSAHAATEPNIVVLVSDDAGYNEFSMHGAKHFPTPRIDSIAVNGVRFTHERVVKESVRQSTMVHGRSWGGFPLVRCET